MAAPGVLAATLVKPGQYEMREYPLPEPAAGCVLIRMEMSGICGTDEHTFQDYTTQYGGRQLEFPIIQGHENVGTIAAIGGDGKYADFEGVELREGDRVVVGASGFPEREYRGRFNGRGIRFVRADTADFAAVCCGVPRLGWCGARYFDSESGSVVARCSGGCGSAYARSID
jgi:threonine dehydrogenase-like Zn-dependent dehydrogenase